MGKVFLVMRKNAVYNDFVDKPHCISNKSRDLVGLRYR